MHKRPDFGSSPGAENEREGEGETRGETEGEIDIKCIQKQNENNDSSTQDTKSIENQTKTSFF